MLGVGGDSDSDSSSSVSSKSSTRSNRVPIYRPVPSPSETESDDDDSDDDEDVESVRDGPQASAGGGKGYASGGKGKRGAGGKRGASGGKIGITAKIGASKAAPVSPSPLTKRRRPSLESLSSPPKRRRRRRISKDERQGAQGAGAEQRGDGSFWTMLETRYGKDSPELAERKAAGTACVFDPLAVLEIVEREAGVELQTPKRDVASLIASAAKSFVADLVSTAHLVAEAERDSEGGKLKEEEKKPSGGEGKSSRGAPPPPVPKIETGPFKEALLPRHYWRAFGLLHRGTVRSLPSGAVPVYEEEEEGEGDGPGSEEEDGGGGEQTDRGGAGTGTLSARGASFTSLMGSDILNSDDEEEGEGERGVGSRFGPGEDIGMGIDQQPSSSSAPGGGVLPPHAVGVQGGVTGGVAALSNFVPGGGAPDIGSTGISGNEGEKNGEKAGDPVGGGGKGTEKEDREKQKTETALERREARASALGISDPLVGPPPAAFGICRKRRLCL
uniref:Uncharacterized protein n=1 Tax=Chromera velia CCMP2878 TaxID=1169474 RepID=A0A0G4IFE6_9ALVE|eukprot:Cvel_13868.t1-p1 / transcript=Cvel_13868.t1 / gene=Cvel_13868 / organism=Chromera_velia_CCMP2878 / gene_product=hypothetical protein / transcript_product=hypothetical protein / location=Cvel_scaffold964:49618-53393(+) / protein_length=500 / sequence_SO=supercontig / SO=protein_coding / is_pseudo=false